MKQLEGKDGSTKKLIAEKLRVSGFTVTADPEPVGQPDAMVTYVDKWMSDITMYMIELITLRDPKTDYPIAMGNSYHTSLTRKSHKEMIDGREHPEAAPVRSPGARLFVCSAALAATGAGSGRLGHRHGCRGVIGCG